MKRILILSLFLLIPGVYAAQYNAPTNPLMSQFTASSIESGVLNNGDDLGNTTAVFFYHDTYGPVLSFKINNSEDLNIGSLIIYASDEKAVIDKGSSNIGLYTLYLPQSNNGKGVYLCPNTKALDGINSECEDMIEFSGPFPQIKGFLIAEIKNITNGVYSVSGIRSGGIGFLNQTSAGSIGNNQLDSKPLVETISPQDGANISNPVFKCYASDDNELKLIELYTDITGTMQSTSRKVTDKTESILEFNPGVLAEGNYSFYCKATDSVLQESQTEKITFQVAEQFSICVEKWECSPWTPLKCEEGMRTRLCSDINSCGTLENKPIESQSCKETCVENWICSDWSENQCGFRSCQDRILCNNQEPRVSKPDEYRDCGSVVIDSNQLYIIAGVFILVLIIILIIFKYRKPVEDV